MSMHTPPIRVNHPAQTRDPSSTSSTDESATSAHRATSTVNGREAITQPDLVGLHQTTASAAISYPDASWAQRTQAASAQLTARLGQVLAADHQTADESSISVSVGGPGDASSDTSDTSGTSDISSSATVSSASEGPDSTHSADSSEVIGGDRHSDGNQRASVKAQAPARDVLTTRIRALQNELASALKREKEKEAARIERRIAKLTSERDQLAPPDDEWSTSASASSGKAGKADSPGTTRTTNVNVDAVRGIGSLLAARKERQRTLAEALGKHVAIDGDTSEGHQLADELNAVSAEINELKRVMRFLGNTVPDDDAAGVHDTAQSPPDKLTTTANTKTTTTTTVTATTTTTIATPGDSPSGTTRSGNMSSLVRKATHRHRKAVEALPPTDSNIDPDIDPILARLSSIRDSARNSSLLLPDNLKKYFSEQALKEISLIDDEIAELAYNADQLQQEFEQLNEKLDDSEVLVDDKRNRSMVSARAEKFRDTWRKKITEISKLIEKREKMEQKVLPDALIAPPKQQEADRKALIDGLKSKKTLNLEDIHRTLLEQRKLTVDAQSTWNIATDLAAGAAGFSVSFLISNTLWRLLPLGPYTVIGAVGAPILAGFLHHATATPVVKQVLARNWTSTSMTDLSNNFKLRGASWSDWWHSESDMRKYDSKDPTHIGKLTIAERLAEEPGFGSLLGKRYEDEEAAYFFYTMNYWCKAAAAAALSTYLATQSFPSKLVEASLHGICGMCSGAEYVLSQQHARSQRTRAEAKVVPTREIFAAEAAALQSLKDDIENELQQRKAMGAADPNDQTKRMLTKELNKVSKLLAIATLKAKPAGILRHEFSAQFVPGDALADTAAESLGRMLSLVPASIANELLGSWRASPDPLYMFLGHAIPQLFLIAPPGFTARPVYIGAIRGLIQAFMNGSARKAAETRRAAQARHDEADQSTEVSTPRSSIDQSTQSEEASAIVSAADSIDEDSGEVWHGNPTKRDEEGGW